MAQRTIARRGALRAIAVLACAAAVPGTARDALGQAKAAKSAVRYQDQPNEGKRCSACVHFVAPGQCKVVEGTISPEGWCMVYSPKQ